MATNLENKIGRIQANVTNALSAISGKGVTVPPGANSDDLEELIENISQAEDLSAELAAQDALISELEAAVANKAAGTVEPPNIQPLTVTENGTYTASGDVDGYSPITVVVPTSGGGDTSIEDGLIQRNIKEYTNSRVTTVGYGMFHSNKTITKLHLSNVETVEDYGLYYCSALSDIDLSSVKTLGSYALGRCESLGNLYLPELETAGTWCFSYFNKASTVTLPKLTRLGASAFRSSAGVTKIDIGGNVGVIEGTTFFGCSKLEALILRSTVLITLNATNVFTSSKIAAGTGYIYVPSALVDSYKAATNWSTCAAQFRAIEDYPDICG